MHAKGESFQGILFAKFASTASRDAALRRMGTKRIATMAENMGQNLTYPLSPLESFLFGAKCMFTSWGKTYFTRTALLR